MTMQDLEGKRVKLSARTITVKDEYDKTRGMVRAVCRFDNWSNRQRADCWSKLKSSGIWDTINCGYIHNCFLDGNELYYLNDTRPLEFFEKHKNYCEKNPVEAKHHAERLRIAEQVAQYMKVINCYILN